jgi:hypothetical protein
LRDNTNYMQTGCLAILDWSASHAEELLRNFYRKGYKSWRQGVDGQPSAFVIPAGQGDRRRVAQMVNVLLRQGIEVGRANGPFTVAEGRFPEGTFVVRLDQPYRNYAVDLLLPQEFPPDAEHQPYDDVSWAMPIHYGVMTHRIDDRRVLEVPLRALREEVRPRGKVEGDGPVFILRDSGQEGLLAARYRLAGYPIEIAETAFTVGGVDYPAGSWVVSARRDLRETLVEVAEELALDFVGVDGLPEVPRHEAVLPRIGVWVPWADTDSIGWLRYTLDQQRIPYTYLRDEDLRAGELRQRVDVILYGNVDLDLQGQIHGIEAQAGPMPFTRTAEFPSHGTPASSEDITGGPGWRGLDNLQAFVDEGGVLITLGNGSTLALETGLVRFVRRSAEKIRTPGVELRARFARPDHPIGYGYPKLTSVFRANTPIYDAPRRWLRMAYCTSCLDGPVDQRSVVLRWGGGDDGSPILVSGGGRNLERLEGRPAILAVPRGDGHVVVYNFNPLHRDLNHSDYRLLWNAILNWRWLGAPTKVGVARNAG